MLNKKNTEMKRLVLAIAAVAVTLTGCSQNSKTPTGTKGHTARQTNVEKTAADKPQAGEGKVTYLTTAEFKRKITDYEKHPQEWVFNGKRPAIVDFYATWCGPCKMTAPILDGLAKDYAGKIDFYKVDIDKESELANVFGIQSIPTFLFIPATGKPTIQMGAMQKEDFERIIQSVLMK